MATVMASADMGRTAMNVLGDATAAVFIAKLEGTLAEPPGAG